MAPLRDIAVEFDAATAAVVSLRDEHDIKTQERVARALEMTRGCRHVVVDLSECTFIDSSVIKVLLLASNELCKQGGLLELVIPQGEHIAVRRVFELMSLERHLPIHDTRSTVLVSAQVAALGTSTSLQALGELIADARADVEERHAA
jgi:anti-anti-sigma factor